MLSHFSACVCVWVYNKTEQQQWVYLLLCVYVSELQIAFDFDNKVYSILCNSVKRPLPAQ